MQHKREPQPSQEYQQEYPGGGGDSYPTQDYYSGGGSYPTQDYTEYPTQQYQQGTPEPPDESLRATTPVLPPLNMEAKPRNTDDAKPAAKERPKEES